VWYGVGVDKGSDMGYCGRLKGCPKLSRYSNINTPNQSCFNRRGGSWL